MIFVVLWFFELPYVVVTILLRILYGIYIVRLDVNTSWIRKIGNSKVFTLLTKEYHTWNLPQPPNENCNPKHEVAEKRDNMHEVKEQTLDPKRKHRNILKTILTAMITPLFFFHLLEEDDENKTTAIVSIHISPFVIN